LYESHWYPQSKATWYEESNFTQGFIVRDEEFSRISDGEKVWQTVD
jgi:hypothetical protein